MTTIDIHGAVQTCGQGQVTSRGNVYSRGNKVFKARGIQESAS